MYEQLSGGVPFGPPPIVLGTFELRAYEAGSS